MKDFKNNPSNFLSSLKNQKFGGLFYLSLSIGLGLVLIIAFQNCGKTGVSSDEDSPTAASDSSNAVFEFYGVDSSQIQSVFWDVTKQNADTCDGENYTTSNYTTSTNKNLEISWDDILNEVTQIDAFVTFSGQSCISFKTRRLETEETSCDVVDTPSRLPSQEQKETDSAQSVNAFLEIQAVAPDEDDDPNTTIVKDYFSVGAAVDFSAKSSSDFTDYQWNIRQIFETAEDISVTNNTQKDFSHTFANRGLYEVSVSAVDSSGASHSDSQKILIGLCEGEEKAVNLILSQKSFDDSTPEEAKQYPFMNYIRPDDTDSDHPIVALSQAGGGECSHSSSPADPIEMVDCDYSYKESKSRLIFFPIYKYNRTSSTKFIAMEFLNMDSYQCFFDDQPDEDTQQMCTSIGCPDDDPDCNTCSDVTEYTRRSDLQPLESCLGKVYDMGALDTDITECTEDIFLFDFVKTDNSSSFGSDVPFYKYCAAQSQYCYFGPEQSRPSEHHCPSE